MVVTKIDKVVANLEKEAAADNAAVETAKTELGDEAVVEETSAQTPTETTAPVEEVPQLTPVEPGQNNQTDSNTIDWEKELREIDELIREPVRVPKEEAPKEEEPLTEKEQENYKKLYEDELNKRIEISGRNSELEATVKYQQTLLDKQSDRQLTIIDKQKDMEAELRRAQSAATPEEITHLVQSYSIYKENPKELHMLRYAHALLEEAQRVTNVSAEGYYNDIFLSLNKDVPNPEGGSSVESKQEQPAKRIPFGF